MWVPLRPFLRLVALTLLLSACATPSTPSAESPPPAAGPRPTVPPPALAAGMPPDLPMVRERQAAIAAALASDPPIVPLAGLDAPAQQVQAQLLAEPQVRALA